jgi:hypothetical protein
MKKADEYFRTIKERPAPLPQNARDINECEKKMSDDLEQYPIIPSRVRRS